jgi:hypothetical protein
MGQHQKKSDGALTAAAAVAMSVLLEMSSTLSTPLEMSTVTSQGEETQLKKQHFEHATGRAKARRGSRKDSTTADQASGAQAGGGASVRQLQEAVCGRIGSLA